MLRKQAISGILILSLLATISLIAVSNLSVGTSQTPPDDLFVYLHTPANNTQEEESFNVTFSYLPYINSTSTINFSMATLYINNTLTTTTMTNLSNNTVNSFNHTFTGNTTVTWNIKLEDDNGRYVFAHNNETGVREDFNFSVAVYEEPEPTDTPSPTPTEAPTDTPVPTATASPTPVITPSPTPEPPLIDSTTIAIIAVVIIAIIVAAGLVLVRRKPSAPTPTL